MEVKVYYDLKAQEQHEVVRRIMEGLRLSLIEKSRSPFPMDYHSKEQLREMDKRGKTLVLLHYPEAIIPKREIGYAAFFAFAHSEIAYLDLAREQVLKSYARKVYLEYGLKYDTRLERALKKAYKHPGEKVMEMERELTPQSL